MSREGITILGIESSCDETSAAIVYNGKVLANIIAGQEVHKRYGGVVPELASRAHQQHIVPTVDLAIRKAGISKKDISAVAFTRGPGLMGSLLVGASFAKSFSLALGIPLIAVNHMQAHVLAHFIDNHPSFPFMCLTVSGGHTQIVLVSDHFDMRIIGETIDDAAGEAFDKAAKIMGLPYPGGPLIDQYGRDGDPQRFAFPHPNIPAYDYSFSGLKTSILYFLQKETAKDKDFIEKNRNDLCASIQRTIVDILIDKFGRAALDHDMKEVALAGGVSANSALRSAFTRLGEKHGWKTHIPLFQYCTDNAAMIAIAGYYKFMRGDHSGLDTAPLARWKF
ncbi:MAG: tRNA (adenosine(37)-N6)-threonylcarbamoyltransferase complex transferase subunit TsaD [Bacteroidota bacterium]